MNIALITEGVSEHRVVKHFVKKFLKSLEVEVNQIQPIIENNKQANTGGWNEVLKYTQRQDLTEILKENQFLVIQIDTDQCQSVPFDISHSTNGQLKSQEELWQDVYDKLTSLIHPDIGVEFTAKIIFAICIHTIECWLVPFHCTGSQKSAVNNCIDPLNRAIRKANIGNIPKADKNGVNAIKAYNALLHGIKKTDLEEAAGYNFGLLKFIESLNLILTPPVVAISDENPR